jgi:protein TonB
MNAWNAWNELGIAPTRDLRAIKLAYAARLRQAHPEDDAEAFQRLRRAYDFALAYAQVTTLPQAETVPPPLPMPDPIATAQAPGIPPPPQPVAAAELLAQRLLPVLPRERSALLETQLRQPGWEALDFRQQLEAALVQLLLRDFDRLQPLLQTFSRHYDWSRQVAWTEWPHASSPVALLLARGAARDWLQGIDNTTGEEQGRLRQALAFLRAPPDEAAFRRYTRHAANRGAMHRVLVKLQKEHPAAAQFEVDLASLDWWLQYDSSLTEADRRPRDHTRSLAALFWICLGVAIYWIGNLGTEPPHAPAPASPPAEARTAPPAPPPATARSAPSDGIPPPQRPQSGPGVNSTILPGATQRNGWPPDYLAEIDRSLSAAVRYPPQALRDSHEGTVLLRLDLRRDGSIEQARVLSSSGVPELDAEAVAAVHRVGGFAPVPAGVYPKAERFSFSLPVRFQLN